MNGKYARQGLYRSEYEHDACGVEMVASLSGEIDAPPISTVGKHVLVIGGGDTGSDCVGTTIRHGAKSVTQIEIMPKPPDERDTSLVVRALASGKSVLGQ